MNKAIFFDRDGVLNDLILNPISGEYEPPHDPRDLDLCPFVIEVLKKLQCEKYFLFIISNQPDYAKGKTTLEKLQQVHNKLDLIFKSEGIFFKEYYYCYHHPDGVVPSYSIKCKCRKPNPFFLYDASRRYNIDLTQSWFIGDRDTDIKCGKSVGAKTIMINYSYSSNYRKTNNSDYVVVKINDILDIILSEKT